MLAVVLCTTVLEMLFAPNILHTKYAEYFYDDALVQLECILVFCYFLQKKTNGTIQKWVEKLAPLTMGVYILHPFVMIAAGLIIPNRTSIQGLAFFCVVLCISAAVSAIFNMLPCLRKMIKL